MVYHPEFLKIPVARSRKQNICKIHGSRVVSLLVIFRRSKWLPAPLIRIILTTVQTFIFLITSLAYRIVNSFRIKNKRSNAFYQQLSVARTIGVISTKFRLISESLRRSVVSYHWTLELRYHYAYKSRYIRPVERSRVINYCIRTVDVIFLFPQVGASKILFCGT